MSDATPLSAAPPQRVAWIDRARGAALVAMIVFHFGFDLRMLGISTWELFGSAGWRWFAVCIATSFIALSGVSLHLASRGGLNRRAFGVRLAKLVGAAILVTLGTWVAMGVPVTFGILHAIALFSVLALAFLRLPDWVVVVAALVVLVLPWVVASEAFSHPLLYPMGLDPTPPPSFDYEPVFPWFAAMLAGLLIGRHAPAPRTPAATDMLARMGRHSLVIYLIHQPILMGGLIGLQMLGIL